MVFLINDKLNWLNSLVDIDAVASTGFVKTKDNQQYLYYFPARKINSVETNKTKNDFSKGGLKSLDMGLDVCHGVCKRKEKVNK